MRGVLRINPPFEQAVKYEFVRYCRGIGLDVGYGEGSCFEHSVGLRLKGDPGDKVPNVRVADLCRLDDIIPGSCDFIVAANVLPKCDDGPAAVADWLSRIHVGGHVCIYEPEGNKSALLATAEAVYTEHGDDEGTHIGVDIIRLETWGDRGAYMVLKRASTGVGYYYNLPRPEKTCLFVRHGGIGDQLQAAYLLPELKRQGYHITVLTTPQGRHIIEHDPHVDEWFMVDKDQVPNNELVPFWTVVAKHYDKFVNLNESCEGSLLTIPGRPAHLWPHRVRHQLFNRNYAEFAAMLAEIPFVPEGRFYETPEERAWALRYKAECAQHAEQSDPFFIMWVLAGSSPHKFTPHQDTVLRMVMGSLPEAVVIMVGNEASKILEVGWEKEKRVIRTSGEMEIRKTLALAAHMDCVVGPETGVLNSICYSDVPKVVLLSHSSHENLTKHWIEAHVIQGVAPCYPCHRLHYTAEYCPQDAETHAAVCQQNVDPRLIYAPIEQEYFAWVRAALIRNAA